MVDFHNFLADIKCGAQKKTEYIEYIYCTTMNRGEKIRSHKTSLSQFGFMTAKF